MARLITPLFFLAFGLFYIVITFRLPDSMTGDPNAPIYFSGVLGISMILLSSLYLVQEWKLRKEAFTVFRQLLQGRTPYLIVFSLIFILIYSFLFERIGFLYSTIIFLSALLFLINGKRKWLQNILVAVIFSFVTWYSFAELLQVSLP